jgi:hypothetical protein
VEERVRGERVPREYLWEGWEIVRSFSSDSSLMISFFSYP